MSRPYRFGFIMSTSLGNLTRYENFRKFAEQDPQVQCVWAPVKHYIAPGEKDPFRFLPGPLRTRAIVLMQSMPVLRQFPRLDAVLIHMYEVDILTALRGYFRRRPVRIISTDDAPVLDPATYPIHPEDRNKPPWKRAIRLKVDLWRARRADALVPFSQWAAGILVSGAHIPAERVTPIHVGLDLDFWRPRERTTAAPTGKLKLLFVGGEFVRKGGIHLLEAFEAQLGNLAELHLVTRSALPDLPPGVHVHADMVPNDPRLAELYREADIFILPTTSDLSSWVILEAMACGCAVVATPVGGIVDLVVDGETGLLVPVGDSARLGEAILSLIKDPARRLRMGASGRARVEAHFDAAKNVPRILQVMKAAADSR
jgi:glycosyltransferase involved in cell wall biosynthesis